MILFSSINQAWVPHLFEKLKKGETEYLQIVKLTYIIMLVMLISYIVFIFVSPFVFDILIDNTYEQGKSYILYISLSFLFQGFYLMSTNYLFYEKKTSMLAGLTVISAILNVVLTIYFIHKFGAIGAAYAMCITWFIFWISTMFAANKVHPMPWSLKGIN